MRLDRRTFLQQAGLALFTWGATETGISVLTKTECLAASIQNYQKTLAQPTNRKLALLVGVFHFSGYGSQIKMPLASDVETFDPTASADAFRVVNSFVPVDGLSSSKTNLSDNS